MNLAKILIAILGLSILAPILIVTFAAIGWSGVGTAVLCAGILAAIWNK